LAEVGNGGSYIPGRCREVNGLDYTNFDWTDQSEFDACEAAAEADNLSLAARYDLGVVLRIVRRMETSPARGAVFAEIKSKNTLYRFADALYSRADATILKPLVLFLYMIKCAVSVGRCDQEGIDAVAVANFDNEVHTVDRLARLIPNNRIFRLSLMRIPHIGKNQLAAALHMVGAARRIWPYLSRLAKSHSFMPSARIASGLAYYIRFSQFFAQYPELKAAIIASNYSPEGLGLAAAAHQTGRKVIYINHAPVPANGALIPPVLADCAVFYGEAIRQTYQRHSRCTAEVALIGQPGTSRPIEWRVNVRKVGIFLTALTRADEVAKLVAEISASDPKPRILIRNHPVGLLKSAFSDLLARHENLEVTIGNPLEDEIADCDLIFCGNSGVAMNVLRGGRPVAYLNALDRLNYDYNGFVERKLVFETTGWSKQLYLQSQAFYANAAWRAVMNSYDASYGADKAELERMAVRKILRFLV
jgi:hypothetical protein